MKTLAATQRSEVPDPLADVDTATITLSPEFLEALRSIAPKRRSSKRGYVVALALVAVAASLGANQSIREAVSMRWLRRLPIATAPAGPAIAALVPIDPLPEARPAAAPSAPPVATAAEAAPKLADRRTKAAAQHVHR